MSSPNHDPPNPTSMAPSQEPNDPNLPHGATTQPAPDRGRWWAGASVGAVAALVASGVTLWAGRRWDGVVVTQLISERLTELLPLAVFRRALDALESDAKPLLLVGLILAQVLVGAVVGLLYVGFARRGLRARLVGAASLAALAWLILSLVAAPLGDIGLFARDVSGDVWRTQLPFVLGALVFGCILAAVAPWPGEPLRQAGADVQLSRRRFAAFAGLALPALAAGLYIGRYARHLRVKSPTPALLPAASGGDFQFAGMPPRITPTEQFYVVSKNFVDPTVDGTQWQLEIGGLVRTPLTLSYTDIWTRPAVTFTSTLECISNPIGGDYISTAVWSGFPLRSLLDEAGLQDGVVDIELRAADGYVESIPLSEALAADTMLVHTMNGQPLDDSHGFPARLIVPGIFGMKNVKWLTGIYAVNHDVQGYWQERGWSDVATVVTMSKFTTPQARTRHPVNQTIMLGGVAFAGDRGIRLVEVSTDDGATWQRAELDEVISPLSWRLWQCAFTPLQPGDLFVQVRATDGEGALQIDKHRPTLPDGATGYHRIRLTIVDAGAND